MYNPKFIKGQYYLSSGSDLVERTRKICNNFLTDLDKFLDDNKDNLTCSDVYNIYHYFYEDLKNIKVMLTVLPDYLNILFPFYLKYFG